MSGWICLHRAILDHWVYQESDALKLWITMLMEANHEAKKRMFNGMLVEVKRGQLIAGRLSLSERTGVSESKIRRYLELLETEEMISQQKTNKYSLITITNYGQYQDRIQQTANNAPTDDQQTATPKQLNNYNNGNKYTEEDFGVAGRMFEAIRNIAPKTKVPNLAKWADSIRLMREQDGFTLDEIESVFTWANRDRFWSLNVLSPNTLRKQFPRLQAQSLRDANGGQPTLELVSI